MLRDVSWTEQCLFSGDQALQLREAHCVDLMSAREGAHGAVLCGGHPFRPAQQLGDIPLDDDCGCDDERVEADLYPGIARMGAVAGGAIRVRAVRG